MSGQRSGGRTRRRVLQRTWTLPAILLSGALMLISSGPPAAASADRAGGDRYPSATAVAGADDVPDTVAVAAGGTVKLGYAPPTPASTVVGPLDLYLLDAGSGPADRVPSDSAWTPTDPQRGPPATQQ